MGCTVGKQSNTVSPKLAMKGIALPRLGPRPWRNEAESLHKAVSGLGTDEELIIQILVGHSNKERQVILKHYEMIYNEDFIQVVTQEVSGSWKEGILALLYTPISYDALELSRAIQNTDFRSVAEVLALRDGEALQKIREVYEKDFSSTGLLHDIDKSFTDKRLSWVLQSLVQVERPWERVKANQQRASQRAEQLHNKGDILEFLCEPVGKAQMRADLAAFRSLTCCNIEDFIETNEKRSEQARDAMKTYVSCIANHTQYFAQELREALKGCFHANQDRVRRIVVSRSDSDLYLIRKEYLSAYGSNLAEDIKKKFVGGNDKVLTAIVNTRGQFRAKKSRPAY